MTYYEYLKNETEDVISYLKENYSLQTLSSKTSKDRDSFCDQLEDALYTEDSVTGNGSGSYTFDQIEAEQNLVSNWDLLKEAITELGPDFDPLAAGPEACDVLIRCYLLPEAIDLTLQRLL